MVCAWHTAPGPAAATETFAWSTCRAERSSRSPTIARSISKPVWSPDGKTLYFVSDRTGIPNIYAYELATGKLAQVSNVLTGAYMPAISNDGKRLVYVGYHSRGFDLFELPIDPERFLPALDAPDDRLSPVEPDLSHAWPVESYNPLPTLRPHAWTFKYGQGNFGNELQISTTGSDAINRHGFDLTIAVPTTTDPATRAEPTASADYFYNRLPFVFRFSAFRGAALRRDYRYGLHSNSELGILTTEHLNGVSTGLSWGVPGEFDTQSVSLNYMIANYNRDLPVGTRADPYSLVAGEPDRGYIAILHLGYGYSNVQGTVYGISAEHGISIGVGLDEAAHALGSESTLTAFSGSIRAYQLMPWAQHHVVALALSGGTSLGSYGRNGLYSTGGYLNESLYDEYNNVLRQSPFVLRGYRPGQFVGTGVQPIERRIPFPDPVCRSRPQHLAGLSAHAERRAVLRLRWRVHLR